MEQVFNNDEWEKCLLAILINDNNIIDIVSGRIDKEVFYNPTHRYIYQKICSQWAKDKKVDLVSLCNSDKEKAGYIASITSCENSSAFWESYVTKLNQLYKARLLKSKLRETSEMVSSENTAELIAELENTLASLGSDKKDAYSMMDLAYKNTQLVNNAYKNVTTYTGVESGFEALDGVIDGWNKDTMYVIGARPSIGKTAFALSILLGIARKGTPVSMFSLEMSADSLYYRMVAAQSNIPMWQIKKGVVCADKSLITRYLNASNIISNLPIRIFDSDIDNDKVLYAKIRYEACIKRSKVIIIDHLGLIEVSDSSGQRYVDVGRITKTLHKMARELDICIIVLAQCGREAEGKKPNLSLLRESGNIEQDADVIMLLHRQRELDDVKEKQNPMAEYPTDVIVAKNRDGQTGTVTFSFKPICMKFREDNSRSALDDNGATKPRTKEQEEKDNEIPY